jgi:hypothetical protein
MTPFAGNDLTLSQLAQIEEAAHRSQTCEANTVLRLAAALREALQAKENACALAAEYKKQVVSGKRNSENFVRLGLAGRAEGR